MIPGKKMMAIFGFCDIRNFTDATEILQEDVMVFVNEIAEIVHSIVDHFSGAANKNIGDAFLLVKNHFNPVLTDLTRNRFGNFLRKKSSKTLTTLLFYCYPIPAKLSKSQTCQLSVS